MNNSTFNKKGIITVLKCACNEHDRVGKLGRKGSIWRIDIENIPSKRTKMRNAFDIVHTQGRENAELNKEKAAIKLTQ